jgi:aminopeptidase N
MYFHFYKTDCSCCQEEKMNRILSKCIFTILFLIGLQSYLAAQRLPEGKYHRNREREIDILHYRADLRFDFFAQKVMGTASLIFHTLLPADKFLLDAIRLAVDEVFMTDTAKAAKSLKFDYHDDKLIIFLDRRYSADEEVTISIRYSALPNAGMYFQKNPGSQGQLFVYTYGEGGLHANWLPGYNAPNDKFTSEMIVTVPLPYSVISNGTLIETTQSPKGGEQTFHWKQNQPHSDYLIALYIGEFEKGDLPPAFGEIPLSYWVPAGRLKEGSYAFRNTTQMVEFFSKRFNYRYPWDKYDQIAVPDYAIGAMEHTTVTGHQAGVLRDENAPENFSSPNFDNYYNIWTADGTIAHELAHHWFGNLTTCRDLGYIWLNESFATYLQFLWDEEYVGKEALLLDCRTALDRYLEYVQKEHVIRPLEYYYFDKTNDIYNEEHTYLKGAIVLHMLRNIVGDEVFFKGCSYFLDKHEFSNVDSQNLQIAFEEATGKNLDWFFEDWIYGGGHPVFEVSYRYLEDRKLLDLTVKQIQPFVEGQDLFTLPVEITVTTASQTQEHSLWCETEEDQFIIECDSKPLMVSFDRRGSLVAEIQFAKELDELLYQLKHDQFPGQIRALRELVRKFPAYPQTLSGISGILSGSSFRGLKAEAALLLGKIHTPEAESVVGQALRSPDYRVRKAAALGLPDFPPEFASQTLGSIIRSDTHTDVVAMAIVSLAKSDPWGSPVFIRKQLDRPAWQDEITLACLKAFKIIGDKSLVKDIRPYIAEKYHHDLRTAALQAWKSCSPADPELHKLLINEAAHAPYVVKKEAIKLLGELRVSSAGSLLNKIARESGDVNFRVEAEKALDEIERVKLSR